MWVSSVTMTDGIDVISVDGVAATVVTILRINILNLVATSGVGSSVCNVAVKGSVAKLRAKILSVLGLSAAIDHSKKVGASDDSEVSCPYSAGHGRMIRTGNLGLSFEVALKGTVDGESAAVLASLGNCNPEGCAYFEAKTNHSVLLLSAAVHVTVGMTDTDSVIELSGIGKDG